MQYNPQEIEAKWQEIWEKTGIYQADLKKAKKPFYNLMMFPYPSAEGLHVGNMYAFVHSDTFSRFIRLKGFDVFEPIGLDGFGIHSENYAIKVGEHISDVSKRTEKHFYEQLHMIGNQFDWSRTVETYKPEYYKWTQWIFVQMFKKGLAYQAESYVNWCPSCKTVLSDEQVISGRCERCDTVVEKKLMKQWFFRITDYAERLLKNLEVINWSERTKTAQRNWIGKSEGATIKFQIKDTKFQIEVFTTRLDTIFGCTYCVLAPEHRLIQGLKPQIKNWDEVEKYIIQAQKKSEMERTELAKEKTGIELKGVKAVNPFNNQEIPVFAADYVLVHYGTGAVMAVPAHDERDFEFAKKYGLPIKPVVFKQDKESRSFAMGIDEDKLKEIGVSILERTKGGFLKIKIPYERLEEYKGLVRKVMQPGFWNEFSISKGFYFIFKHKDGRIEEMELNEETNDLIDEYGATFNDEKIPEKFQNVYSWPSWISEEAFYHDLLIHTDNGVLVNSGDFNGLTSEEARKKMTAWLEKNKIGGKKIHYKLRDWCISRQRYWGPPIPMIYCQKCDWQPVAEKDLPVLLPETKDYLSKNDGLAPLARNEKFWKTKCPKCGGPAKRETDVSDTFLDSSWYFFRYPSVEFDDKIFDKERTKKWLPIDMYIGGQEHAVLHLLYSRFITMFFKDLGLIDFEEPYKRFFAHGLLIREGAKMSKSKGNIVNPDEYIKKYGADSVRMYLMFLGDVSQGGDWRDAGMNGMYKFVKKAWVTSQKIIKKGIKKTECEDFVRHMNKTVKWVESDLDRLKFNTAISFIMSYLYFIKIFDDEGKMIGVDAIEILAKLIAPFAPHLAEEIWENLGHKESIFKEKWPSYDPKLIKDKTIPLIVQINGKMRDKLEVKADISEKEARELALASEKIKKWVAGKEIKKTIFVPGKLINIVLED